MAAPQSVVEQRVRSKGAVQELDGDVPTIIFAPHFYGLDAGGLVLPLRTSRAFTSIFHHPDPVIGRLVHGGPPAFWRRAHAQPRRRGQAHHFQPAQGVMLYLLSDMDFGR